MQIHRREDGSELMRVDASLRFNYVVYNYAHDLSLPGASAGPIPFLMYPQCETGGGRKDSLEPATFKYQITAREVI